MPLRETTDGVTHTTTSGVVETGDVWIEDWEDQSFQDYTDSTPVFDFETANPIQGTASLTTTNYAGNYRRIKSTYGLGVDQYPVKGTQFQFLVRAPIDTQDGVESSRAGLIFGADEANDTADTGYIVRFDAEQDRLRLLRLEGPGTTTKIVLSQDTSSVAYTAGEVWRVVISWDDGTLSDGGDNTIRGRLYDTTDTLVGFVEATDSTYADNWGVGVEMLTTDETHRPVLDAVRFGAGFTGGGGTGGGGGGDDGGGDDGGGDANVNMAGFEDNDLSAWNSVFRDKRDVSIMHRGMFDGRVGGMNGGAPESSKLSMSNADFIVTTGGELSSALNSAGSGDLVWITGDSEIWVGDTGGWTVPSGVTVASNRGQTVNGIVQSGARLFSSNQGDGYAFHANSGARVNGLHLDGPSSGVYVTHSYPAYYGVQIFGSNVLVDNCEIEGWRQAGVRTNGYSPTVRYCFIHTQPFEGLGYGVDANSSGADPLVEYCWFDWNRHAIAAATGSASYIARNCYFGPRTIDHVCDHHGPSGGARITLEDCTFDASHVQRLSGQESSYNPTPAVYIRGDGELGGGLTLTRIHFAHLQPPDAPGSNSEAVHTHSTSSTWSGANVTFNNCEFGPTLSDSNVGAPRVSSNQFPVHGGDRSLKLHGDANPEYVSTSGLETYPSVDGTFTMYFYLMNALGEPHADVFTKLSFCHQRNTDAHDCYEIEIDARQTVTEAARLQKDVGGSDTTLDSFTHAWAPNTWYRINGTLTSFGTDMEITLDITNDATGAAIGTLTYYDTSPFTSGGVGIQKNGYSAVIIDDWSTT